MQSENRQKTLAALNDLWQGNPICRTRAGEGSFTLHGRRLAVHLMVQPGVAHAFMADPIAADMGFSAPVPDMRAAEHYRHPPASRRVPGAGGARELRGAPSGNPRHAPSDGCRDPRATAARHPAFPRSPRAAGGVRRSGGTGTGAGRGLRARDGLREQSRRASGAHCRRPDRMAATFTPPSCRARRWPMPSTWPASTSAKPPGWLMPRPSRRKSTAPNAHRPASRDATRRRSGNISTCPNEGGVIFPLSEQCGFFDCLRPVHRSRCVRNRRRIHSHRCPRGRVPA